MPPTTSQLVFNPTPEAFAVGVAFVFAVMVLGIMAWRRSGYRKLIGWLELLRVVIAACIAVTLLQPEWLETFKPQTRPVLAVLADVSASMSTKDVIRGQDAVARE
jgi:Mn2+/Fe2+ NRAMP family transporter